MVEREVYRELVVLDLSRDGKQSEDSQFERKFPPKIRRFRTPNLISLSASTVVLCSWK